MLRVLSRQATEKAKYIFTQNAPALNSRTFASSRGVTEPVYIVFGATGGIGAALSKRLGAQSGATVVLAADEREKLDQLHSEIKGSSHVTPLDALNEDQVRKCVMEAAEEYGRLDGVANCIGPAMFLKPSHIVSNDEFMEALQTNALTAFNILKPSVQAMMRNGGGSIAFCSAAIAHAGSANHDAIAAAKGAVSSLALSAASTYSPHNIRINCIAPGLIRTPMTASITENEAPLEVSDKMIPLGRPGEPDEAAAALEFLLHPGNSYITGQVLGVDGGLSTVRPSTSQNEPAREQQDTP